MRLIVLWSRCLSFIVYCLSLCHVCAFVVFIVWFVILRLGAFLLCCLFLHVGAWFVVLLFLIVWSVVSVVSLRVESFLQSRLSKSRAARDLMQAIVAASASTSRREGYINYRYY